MKVFFDCEFTGLHQNTTLISLALISETGNAFYAEFNDYDRKQVTQWTANHVLSELIGLTAMRSIWRPEDKTMLGGGRDEIAFFVRKWLSRFDLVEMWGDVLAYDWVLFCELFDAKDSAERLPSNIYYIPFDFATLLDAKGIDPDTDRLELSGLYTPRKHNALDDAIVLKECYKKIMQQEGGMKRAVIAGSYAEYREWLKKTVRSPQGYPYVSESTQLYGRQDIEIHWVGTWADRRNRRELEAVAEAVGTPETRTPVDKG